MKILPFYGILYDTKKVRLDDVVTLPYDKISPEQKLLYEKRSPYNMVHLILPKSHGNAHVLFEQWLKDGILKKDKEQAIYVYEQEYEYPKGVTAANAPGMPGDTGFLQSSTELRTTSAHTGVASLTVPARPDVTSGRASVDPKDRTLTKTRRGFIALLELQTFGKDTIMPHERTFSKIVDERMELLDSTQANIEQIFILYNGKNINKLFNGSPRLRLKDEFGITHRFWNIIDEKIIKTIQDAIRGTQLFIADGHHRYTASLQYKEKMKGDEYIMATFIDSNDPGLTILPTHRVLKEVPGLKNELLLKKIEEYFILEKVEKGDRPLFPGGQSPFLRIYLGGDDYYSLRLKKDISLDKILRLSRPRAWLYLDVNILHLLILKHIMGIDTQNMAKEGNIVYLREESEAIDMVKSRRARAAFLLNPTKIEQVKEIVALNEVMPHKSTDFYPKLHSGLVMRKF